MMHFDVLLKSIRRRKNSVDLLRNKLLQCVQFVSICHMQEFPHVAMTNTCIYHSNHPFLLEQDGRWFRDVPAEVRMTCASPWLLHFIHQVSGWLP